MMREEVWQRYASDLDGPPTAAVTESIESLGRAGGALWGRVLRLRALEIFTEYDEADFVDNLMARGARLGDPYAQLWRAEVLAERGQLEKALTYLKAKHIEGSDPSLDRAISGRLAVWSWRLYQDQRSGSLLPDLALTSRRQLTPDAADYLVSVGQESQARALFVSGGIRDPWIVYLYANWLYARGELEESLRLAKETAETYPMAAYLTGKILAINDDPCGVRWLRIAADAGVSAARRDLRRMDRERRKSRRRRHSDTNR